MGSLELVAFCLFDEVLGYCLLCCCRLYCGGGCCLLLRGDGVGSLLDDGVVLVAGGVTGIGCTIFGISLQDYNRRYTGRQCLVMLEEKLGVSNEGQDAGFLKRGRKPWMPEAWLSDGYSSWRVPRSWLLD